MEEKELLERLYPEANQKEEYIICAAIWYSENRKFVHQPKNISSGYVMCGRRHHNIISLRAGLTGNPTKDSTSIQGFVTSKDRFVDRKEAGEIALKAGQITEQTDCLFSEDIY